jgi:hypothetical protein
VRRHGRPVDPERVLAFGELSQDVSYDVDWSRERQALARLLAMAPRVLANRSAAE